MQNIEATYDSADDKIRLRADSRLDAETYARVKAAGYGWAPKQGCFYAVWSPGRSREPLLEARSPPGVDHWKTSGFASFSPSSPPSTPNP